MRRVIRPLFKPFVTSLTQQSMRAKNISAEFGKPINVVRMREYINKVCGASLFYDKQMMSNREKLADLLVDDQNKLKVRCVNDSKQEVIIPLSNPYYQEKYLKSGVDGKINIRIGQLLEDLDSFAVLISYEHNDLLKSEDGRSPYSIVTAMVDELILYDSQIKPNYDVTMRGHVSWVGKTSIEVAMVMSQFGRDFLATKFLMVARDASGKKPAIVHPLRADTDEDKLMLAEGDERKLERIKLAKESLFKTPPTIEEMKKVHQIFLSTVEPGSQSFRSRCLPSNHVWMSSTNMKNAIICFPQVRNVHNKIFGGFIMRSAFELAYAAASVFGKGKVIPKAIDDIIFQTPVSIGALLQMSSMVSISDPPYFMVRVRAEILDQQTGEHTTSNVFHFTFTCEQPELLPNICPQTYGEAMLLLDGARRLKSQKEKFEQTQNNE